jgi:proteasome lid subunit RPN8/RPN11
VPSVRRPRIWISEKATATIQSAAAAAHPNETGGVFLGVYTERDRPWVVEAVVVPGESGRAHFVLPRDARPRVVDAARKHDKRLGYLGDWHSHPSDVGPSETDIETMKVLAADRAAGCAHPVLVIARRARGGYRLDARQVATRKLRKLRVIAAGSLPKERRSRSQRRPA